MDLKQVSNDIVNLIDSTYNSPNGPIELLDINENFDALKNSNADASAITIITKDHKFMQIILFEKSFNPDLKGGVANGANNCS